MISTEHKQLTTQCSSEALYLYNDNSIGLSRNKDVHDNWVRWTQVLPKEKSRSANRALSQSWISVRGRIFPGIDIPAQGSVRGSRVLVSCLHRRKHTPSLQEEGKTRGRAWKWNKQGCMGEQHHCSMMMNREVSRDGARPAKEGLGWAEAVVVGFLLSAWHILNSSRKSLSDGLSTLFWLIGISMGVLS